ncbi:helix-turn-helix transcriptional regulator [Planctomycetota bacterium]
MKASKKKKLEAAGWKVGSTAEFLELSDAEEMLVNMKVALAKRVKAMRQEKKITQQRLAKMIGSSQSRVAKLETADRSVSMELLIRSLLSMGATRAQIGTIMGTRNVKRAKKATKVKKKALVKR